MVAFVCPAVEGSRCLVVERVERLQLTALVIVDVVAHRVLEVDVKTPLLIREVGVDGTIDVGIGGSAP